MRPAAPKAPTSAQQPPVRSTGSCYPATAAASGGSRGTILTKNGPVILPTPAGSAITGRSTAGGGPPDIGYPAFLPTGQEHPILSAAPAEEPRLWDAHPKGTDSNLCTRLVIAGRILRVVGSNPTAKGTLSKGADSDLDILKGLGGLRSAEPS